MKENLNLKVKEKIEQITNYYKNPQLADSLKSISLMGGTAGLILLQAAIFLATNDPEFKSLIHSGLDDLTTQIESSGNVISNFSNGIAGVGWLLHFLRKNNILDIDLDPYLEDLDSALENQIIHLCDSDELDILHGAMGIGFYFLTKDHKALAGELVRALESRSVVNHSEVTWERSGNYYEQAPHYDFGLAHGNASIIYFLGKCYRQNIYPEVCGKLIEGSFNFFLSNIQDYKQEGSFFPSFRLAKDNKLSPKSQTSRLAWCYGDLGILHSLLLAARWVKDYKREQLFLEMLEKTTLRKFKESMAQDACFCHGSSGIGYIYLNLNKMTQRKVFLEAASYWMKVTLLMGEKTGGLAGYKFFSGQHAGWRLSDNLLTGLGGPLLFLLEYYYNMKNTGWDECLFLS